MILRLLLITQLTVFSVMLSAKEITVGDQYPVVEKSMEELIVARINSADMPEKLLSYTKSFEAGIEVPEASADKVYEYIPWYTLEEDIKDQNNQILFPKGFRFNPLTKIRAPGRLVFFNESQIDWVLANAKQGDSLVMTSGDVYTAMTTLKARVYLLDAKTYERLAIKAVPSTYEQKTGDQFFTVQQYAL
jgi:conjugal transfer pilus assembly protein TraW